MAPANSTDRKPAGGHTQRHRTGCGGNQLAQQGPVPNGTGLSDFSVVDSMQSVGRGVIFGLTLPEQCETFGIVILRI